jgi:hypothetical protein
MFTNSDKAKFDRSVEFCDNLGSNIGNFINKLCINIYKLIILNIMILFFGSVHIIIALIRKIFGK